MTYQTIYQMYVYYVDIIREYDMIDMKTEDEVAMLADAWIQYRATLKALEDYA